MLPVVRGSQLEAERVVHRDQHVADAIRAADHDHASYMSGALDDPLAEPHQLGAAAGVDRVLARAVLARHLARPGVHAERLERPF